MDNNMFRILCLALLLISCGKAAPALVQAGPVCVETGGVSALIPASGNCIYASSVTNGNVSVLFIGGFANSATAVTSIATTRTGGYTQIYATLTANNTFGYFYCAPITSSGTETVLVTMNGTLWNGHLIMAEISGTNGCTLDGTATGTSGGGISGSKQPGSLTTSNANSIVLNGMYASTVFQDLALTAGWTTILLNNLDSSNGRTSGLQYQVAASGSFNPTSTANASSEWSNVIMALQSAAGSSTVRRTVLN